MQAIESLRVGAAEVAHGVREVAVNRAHQEVLAIGKKCVPVDLEAEAGGHGAELVEKQDAVVVAREDRGVPHAAVSDVVPGTRKIDAKATGHERSITRVARKRKAGIGDVVRRSLARRVTRKVR
jgi:hypothetical protein